jgi:hypothetical protein
MACVCRRHNQLPDVVPSALTMIGPQISIESQGFRPGMQETSSVGKATTSCETLEVRACRNRDTRLRFGRFEQ